jgi:hypothetical protein
MLSRNDTTVRCHLGGTEKASQGPLVVLKSSAMCLSSRHSGGFLNQAFHVFLYRAVELDEICYRLATSSSVYCFSVLQS